MSLLGLLCLLLAIVATLLFALWWMQRRELGGIVQVNDQLERLLAQRGPLSGRIYLQSDEPRLQELAQGLNRVLVRASEPPERPQPAGASLFSDLADRSHEIVLIHRDNILFANRQFAALVGVEREALRRRDPDPLERSIRDLVGRPEMPCCSARSRARGARLRAVCAA